MLLISDASLFFQTAPVMSVISKHVYVNYI